MNKKSSEIVWDGEVPKSVRYDDIYYSPINGLAESRHNFLVNNRLPERWRGEGLFRIGEIGFGTGLNFLLTWMLWRGESEPKMRLHFVSCELYPLQRSEIARALAPWAELRETAEELLRVYPEEPGEMLESEFDNGRVKLTVFIGDGREVIHSYPAPVQAWYFDGFTPRTNQELWGEEIFRAAAERSLPGVTTLGTFSVAGVVRKGLSEAGFSIEKVAGYGGKRECLRGMCGTEANSSPA